MPAIPILKVFDIERAERFYSDVLGATENWSWSHSEEGPNPGYRSLTLEGGEIHLSSFAGDGAFGTAIYIAVDDVDRLAAIITEGAPGCVEFGPVDQEWGQRELYIRDLDNNALRFGSPSPKK